jgi:hypothetical protein
MMNVPDTRTAAGFVMWTIGVLLLSGVARIGWEMGGWVWSHL